MKRFKKHIKIWWRWSANSFSVVVGQRVALSMFLTGKVLRFVFFFLFLFFLLKGVGTVSGYTTNQIIFFYLTFNLIDVTTQFLFRGVYSFRPMIIKGDFDLVLVKPINVLFRVLMGGADIIDLITIPPLIILVVIYGIGLQPTFIETVIYIILLVNGFLIATAFHIAILAFAIVTLEVDHAVMIYRDITNLGKLPVDIYKEPLRSILTYILPVGVMITFPAKSLMGLNNFTTVLISLMVGFSAVFIALKYWNYALTKYTSASS